MFTRAGKFAALKPRHAATNAFHSEIKEEARHQMVRWTRISVGMLMLSGAFAAVQYRAHLYDDIGHHEQFGGVEPKYSYLKIRNKPFPWHYSNCDLLDFHCKELARAAEQALTKSSG